MINTILKWLACASTIAGAMCTSLAWDPMNIILLNIGAILYLTWSLRIREWNLVAVNGGLVTIYAFGAILRM